MIVIVDYGMGNVGSILNMLKKIGAAGRISSSPEEIASASRLILPGVGSFDRGMANIERLGLLPVLHQQATEARVPVLGICLGMQLLTARSEEGQRPGLGWINGETVRFRSDRIGPGLKIPHMRWNTVTPIARDSLFQDLDEDHGFYFVHSYHVVCAEDEVLATTTHGHEFVSSVRRDNIFGTQFHPEKSHRHGLQLLRNFIAFA